MTSVSSTDDPGPSAKAVVVQAMVASIASGRRDAASELGSRCHRSICPEMCGSVQSVAVVMAENGSGRTRDDACIVSTSSVRHVGPFVVDLDPIDVAGKAACSCDHHDGTPPASPEVRVPTVHRFGPYRFHFYSNENIQSREPPHVHVVSPDGEAVFWLDPVRLREAWDYTPREIERIRRMVVIHRELILNRWYEHFGK